MDKKSKSMIRPIPVHSYRRRPRRQSTGNCAWRRLSSAVTAAISGNSTAPLLSTQLPRAVAHGISARGVAIQGAAPSPTPSTPTPFTNAETTMVSATASGSQHGCHLHPPSHLSAVPHYQSPSATMIPISAAEPITLPAPTSVSAKPATVFFITAACISTSIHFPLGLSRELLSLALPVFFLWEIFCLFFPPLLLRCWGTAKKLGIA